MSDALPGEIASRLRFDSAGLIPAVVTDSQGGEVLMVGYMDATALARTLGTGRVWFYSRSRQEYWRKGDTSGHVQLVRRVRIDCDGDCLLVEAVQVGPACHTGTRSCFDAGGDLPVTSLIDHWPGEESAEGVGDMQVGPGAAVDAGPSGAAGQGHQRGTRTQHDAGIKHDADSTSTQHSDLASEGNMASAEES